MSPKRNSHLLPPSWLAFPQVLFDATIPNGAEQQFHEDLDGEAREGSPAGHTRHFSGAEVV